MRGATSQPKRCLTKEEAAEYCGCKSLAAFDAWHRKGIFGRGHPH